MKTTHLLSTLILTVCLGFGSVMAQNAAPQGLSGKSRKALQGKTHSGTTYGSTGSAYGKTTDAGRCQISPVYFSLQGIPDCLERNAVRPQKKIK